MIKSASQSSLTNDVKYRNMSAGAVPSSEYLIETVVVGATAVPTVEFLNLSQHAGIYQHLQIVCSIRSSRVSGDINDGLFVRFNGDGAANYSFHTLGGNGSSPFSFGVANSSQGCFAGYFIGASGPANTFGSVTIDILDPFEGTKNPTVRALSGTWSDTTNQRFSQLSSGSWRNTSPISSITLRTENSQNFVTGSRFSLYGVTA